jgi:heterodisulfide reductase subunit A-like polyferredoxin
MTEAPEALYDIGYPIISNLVDECEVRIMVEWSGPSMGDLSKFQAEQRRQ